MDTLINNQNTLNIQPEIIKEAQENLKQLKIKRSIKNKKNILQNKNEITILSTKLMNTVEIKDKE